MIFKKTLIVTYSATVRVKERNGLVRLLLSFRSLFRMHCVVGRLSV